jgi:hypothetical protein
LTAICPDITGSAAMRLILRCLASLAALLAPAPVAAQPDEDGIRATVARWYAELAKKEAGRLDDILAPGFIDASPPYSHANNGSAALGPRIYTSLPAEALKFAYDVEAIRADASFARVRVWERGYFYAWAAQTTYERAASTDFILERQEKGSRWLIVAHQSGSYGIPPNKVTNPIPDLRDYFYATQGKDRDPAKDAEAARAN